MRTDDWCLGVIEIEKTISPLFHLQNDGFWQLIQPNGNRLEEIIDSKEKLQRAIIFGRLDDPLFELLTQAAYRYLTRIVLVDRCFPERYDDFFQVHPILSWIRPPTSRRRSWQAPD